MYPYLLRGLLIDRPNQVWCADITYIPMAKGFVYLVAVMDWFSRRVLAWRVSITMDSDFCVGRCSEAMEQHGRPEIFNTDQGVQFTSADFLAGLEAQAAPDQHGWQGAVSGQHLHRAAVAEPEIRGGVPQGLWFGGRGADWDRLMAEVLYSWLRVSGATEMPQIDQRVPHQLHAVMPLLNELEPQQQPFEFILPREGPFHA